MSQSDSWSERDDNELADAEAVAEQMRAATTSLRARFSIVRNAEEQVSAPDGA